MSPQILARVNRSRPTSRELQVVTIGGVIHVLLAVGIRAAAGAPTELSPSPYLTWALVGGFVIGASFTGLYVRAGLVLPGVVTLALLAAGGVITHLMYASLNGASPAFAWTPMTIYVAFWPTILGVVVLVGSVEWVGRRAKRRFR